jgi:ketosteroid isomerase-like protein
MKRCPTCQSIYADESLRFCLQDGAALESARADSSDEFKTLVLPENAVSGRESLPTEVMHPEAYPTARPHQPSPTSHHRPRETNHVTSEQEGTNQPPRRSNAALVGITIAATIALLALGGLTAWLLLGDKKETAAHNDNAANINTTRANDNQYNATPNANARTASNVNAAASPTPSSTPAPTPAANASAEEREVRAALNGWLTSFRARDIDSYMAYYADVLDAYYLSRNTSVERVRADKLRAFSKYTTIDVSLSDIRIQVDASGQRAVAIFNKSYRFTGEGVNPFTGGGLNKFTWKKIGGEWLITGEEDL